MNIARTRISLAAAAMSVCFAATSAFAAVVATNDFETAWDGFSSDGEAISTLAELAAYDGDRPSASAPYPFSQSSIAEGFGAKYMSVDSDTNTLWRTFDSRTANTYLDAYMKFEATSGDVEYPDGAKFVLYLDAATSNLCVISGTSAGDRTPVTNRLTSSGQVLPGTWGRMTIKCLSGDVFSFQVLLNGTMLSTAGSVDTFYSLESGTSISQFGVKGTGAIDDFVARSTDPFIVNPVATIGEEGYATLSDASAEAGAGDTVVLQNTTDENITLSVAGVAFSTNGVYYGGSVIAASGLGWTLEGGVYTSIVNTSATWTDDLGDHDWTKADNWSSHGVPTSITAVTIPATEAEDGWLIYLGGNAQAMNVATLGDVTFKREAGSSYYGGNLVVYGDITTGATPSTITLKKSSIWTGDNIAKTIGTNIKFEDSCSLTASSQVTGSFIVNGHVSGTGTFTCERGVTFNGDIALEGETAGKVVIKSTSAVNNAVTLGDNGTLEVNTDNVTFGAGFSLKGSGVYASDKLPKAEIKAALQDADDWTGTCYLKGSIAAGAFSFNWWGNTNSIVKVDGVSGHGGYIGNDAGDSYIAKLRGLVIEGNGVTFNDSFAWTRVYIEAPVSGSGPINVKTKCSKSAGECTRFIFTDDMSGYTGIINNSIDKDNGVCPSVVVFLGKKSDGTYDDLPTPAAYGQMFVTTNANVTLNNTWTNLSGVVINGNVTLPTSAAKLYGAISGDGKITAKAAPSVIPSWTAENWTGTYVADYDVTADASFNMNAYGVEGSKFEIATNRTLSGYINNSGAVGSTVTILPEFVVSGTATFNNGYNNKTGVFSRVSGSGTLSFTGKSGNGHCYVVSSLENWDGTLTVSSLANYQYTRVDNIVSGSGTVSFGYKPSSAPTVGADYTGKVILDFNWNNVDLSAYSGDNAELVLNSMTGYFAENNGGSAGIKGKTVVNGTVAINNGWPRGDGNYWSDNRCVKFNTLEITGSLSLVYPTGTGWQNLWGYVSAVALDGDSTGSITVGNNFLLRVNAVAFASAPSGTGRLVSLLLAGEDDSGGYSHKGKLYGPNGVAGEAIPVIVGGVATGQMLVYATVNDAPGLYLAVARIGGDKYYATFQAALDARSSGAASGDIYVLDGAAPIPVGYKVKDGKLVKDLKPIIMVF